MQLTTFLAVSLSVAGGAVASMAPAYGSYGSSVPAVPAMAESTSSTAHMAMATSMAAPSSSAWWSSSSTYVAAASAPPTYASSPPSYSSPPAKASESQVQVHVVKVGGSNGELTFTPNNIVAQPGAFVQFQFWPKNHSVVQAAFSNPCEPINNVMSNVTGFFSGFMPVAANASQTPLYTIQVTDTKPIWFYCSQGKHCQAGMVGAINAPTTGAKTLDAFIQAAKGSKDNLSPGQSPSSGSSAAASSTGGLAVAPSSSLATSVIAAPTGATSTTTGLIPPAQQTTNAAPSSFSSSSSTLGGMLLAAAVAFFAL